MRRETTIKNNKFFKLSTLIFLLHYTSLDNGFKGSLKSCIVIFLGS